MRLIPALLILLWPSWSVGLDLNSYCQGWCSQRYESGFYRKGRCECTDSYPINLKRRIESPRRPAPHEEPQVYYGVDVMHESPAGDDAVSPYADPTTY